MGSSARVQFLFLSFIFSSSSSPSTATAIAASPIQEDGRVREAEQESQGGGYISD
jgi:hypothetical protein